MRRETQPGNRDFSKYDQMPTEQLEEIIRADFWLSDDGTPDDELIDHIMEVIIQRDKDTDKQEAPHFKPWEEIQKKQTQNLSEEPAADNDIDMPAATDKKKYHGLFKKFSTIAAAFVCVILFGLVVPAYAMGIDVWRVLIHWTESTLNVEVVSTPGTDINSIPELLREMARRMATHGIVSGVLPSYLPAGYEVIEENCSSNDVYSTFYIAFLKGEDILSVSCTQYYTDNFSSEYEKDDPDPTIYHINGMDFYVFANFGNTVIYWSKDNLDCAIIGVPEGEIEKILESIR